MKLASIPEFIKADINKLKAENLYRKLRIVENHDGSIIVNNKEIILIQTIILDYLQTKNNKKYGKGF